jgi:hypothetical protein
LGLQSSTLGHCLRITNLAQKNNERPGDQERSRSLLYVLQFDQLSFLGKIFSFVKMSDAYSRWLLLKLDSATVQHCPATTAKFRSIPASPSSIML